MENLASPRKIRNLHNDWKNVQKDWYTLYKWKYTKCKGYTEAISDLICNEFKTIELSISGLRDKKPFIRTSRNGKPNTIKSSDLHRSEKLWCIAMFNQGEVIDLGKAIDYELPLKDNKTSPHGKIDVLFRRVSEVLSIEFKGPHSNESILKALLECFVYARLLRKRWDKFATEYEMPKDSFLRPVVVTFRDSYSGTQLEALASKTNCWPKLHQLLKLLNSQLAMECIEPIELQLRGSSNSRLCKTNDGYIIFENGTYPLCITRVLS